MADLGDRLWTWETAVAVAVLLLAVGVVVGRRRWHAFRHSGGGNLIHIAAPPQVDPYSAAALWSHLTGLTNPTGKTALLGQPHVAFEYFWSGRSLDIRMWIPDSVPVALVTAAVTAAWPGATTTVSEADTLITGICRTGQITFGTDVQPLNASTDVEPLRALLAAADSPGATDTTIVQVLARPATAHRRATIRPDNHGPRTSLWGMVADLVDPVHHKHTRAHPVPLNSEGRQTLERRRQVRFEIAVRYAAATRSADSAATRRNLAARAGRVATAMAVVSGPAGTKRRRLSRRVLEMRRFSGGKLVTVDELAAIAHIPADEALPQVARAGSTLLAPVPDISSGGRDTKRLGRAAVGGRPVAISAADARHHMHIVGATGSGKSTLLANLILADIAARRGVVAIDPKGDLITDILDRLDPDTVAGRLHIIDPDQRHGAGINPLAGDDHDLVVDHFVGICRRIWERHWGPRADDIMRSALMTLLVGNNATLDHLPTLLGDRQARAPIVAGLRGPLADFWAWYDRLQPGVQAQAAGPVVARIRAFMMRRFVADTIGNPARDINIRDILDHAGILLVRLPKGQLGDDTARMLGSIVVARTWQAAVSRATLPEPQRRDAVLYLDEVQNFLNLPQALNDVLAEARGYRLSLILAHQHMAQLPRDMQAAISANARTKVAFHVSPEDAKDLSRHTEPHQSAHDLAHLEAYTAVCRPFSGGRERPAFTLATDPPVPVIGRSVQARRVAAHTHRGPLPGPAESGDRSQTRA